MILSIPTCLEAFAEESQSVSGVITRIEPKVMIGHVKRHDGKEDPLAPLMPLYAGDEIVVESLGTRAHMRLFGNEDIVVGYGDTFKVPEPVGERSLLESARVAVLEELFRTLTEVTLITRSHDRDRTATVHDVYEWWRPQLVMFLEAGERRLLIPCPGISGTYRIIHRLTGQDLAGGEIECGFTLTSLLTLKADHRYRLEVTTDDGHVLHRSFRGIAPGEAWLPLPASGVIDGLSQLAELASRGDGLWRFEALQGIQNLPADSIDREALMIALLAL